MTCIDELRPTLGVKEACQTLGLPRATFYRWQNPQPKQKPVRRAPAGVALSQQERQKVLDALHSPEYVDSAPHAVYASLLDRGSYLCSIRTMYRILSREGEVRERRNQRRRPKYKRPELLAVRPNELWSWDITRLRGPAPGVYYQLYVIIDVFSRYVPGWLLACHERGGLASRLIEETCRKQGIEPDQLTIHADNGAAMKSKPVKKLLADLAVIRSHSRPYRSNDNPFSESQFKTLKYCPEFPSRFNSLEDARQFCRVFFDKYNKHHYHTGIALLHPEDLHYGRTGPIIEKRNRVLEEARLLRPERFKGKSPRKFEAPKSVWINPPIQNNNQQKPS